MWYRTVTAGKHTSAIVALWLPIKEARKLALSSDNVKKAEGADELHITLAYLGKADDLADKKQDILSALKLFGKRQKPLEGKISGCGRFQNTPDGGEVFYASFDSPGLFEFRHNLILALESAGVEIDGTHGFTPHITLSYIENGEQVPDLTMPDLQITFDEIRLAWASTPTRIPLTGENDE
jgi:2'-5' RNA ligase